MYLRDLPSSIEFLVPLRFTIVRSSPTMQLSRSYDRKKPRGALQQPQGARLKCRTAVLGRVLNDNVTSLTQNASPLRQVRALPAVPTCPTSARTNRTSPLSQSAHGRRPLPCCPTSSPLNSPSSSTQFVAPTIEIPSAGDHSPPVAFSIPPTTRSSPSPPLPKGLVGNQFGLRIYKDPSFVLEPMEFEYPRRCSDFDCTTEDDEDEDADIMEPYQPKRVEYKKPTNCRGMFAKRTIPRQPTSSSPPTTKWVKEKKGQRATITDYEVLDLLRSL
ncbi:hypothetical protein BYT27DRAFT_7196800 [Phlegmacium glaucopus]|nr:hypothetical protein BYT27DRAFT_7196800 [Phlegmacium glaucopus]